MRTVPVEYIPGGTWADCPVCGFKVRLNSMRLRWDNLWTCPDDWDPRPPELTPPNVGPEGLPRYNAQPEMPIVFVDQSLGPDDL